MRLRQLSLFGRTHYLFSFFFFFQAEDGIRDLIVTGVQTCALPIYSPANARPRPSSSSSGCIEARKPTRPKFTPITGTRVPRKRVSARSIVPSPPRTTARSAVAGSPSALGKSCFSRSSSGKTSSTPCSPASASSRPSARPIVSRLPCVTTAARRTRLPDCAIDPVVELIRTLRPPAVHEVEEELAVPLRAGQARGYASRD